MIDSGVNPTHPHLRDGASGFSGCVTDSLGHGTAVAAAICDLAPNVWIHSIAVLDASGRCSCDRVVEAIDEAILSEVDLINLSVGLLGADLEGRFGDVLAKVKKQLATASNTIESTERRTRAMARTLRKVEQLPGAESDELLELLPEDELEEE